MNQGRQMQLVAVNPRNQGHRVVDHYARNCRNSKRVRDFTYYTKRLMFVQQEDADIPLKTEQHDLLSYASDEEREEGELTTNYLFVTKLQSAS
ncbi:hypothetical protein Tco_0694102 [Tanacetum coccineum]